MLKKNSQQNQKGTMMVYLIIIIFIISTVAVPLLASITQNLRLLRATGAREQALQIAEAGVNYYQWHLAHYVADYQDGTGGAGPYVHNYIDFATQQNIGKYSLVITPPSNGSTIVTIQSTGWTNYDPNTKRVITARYGIPSLAQYAFLSNDIIWIGDTETVNGQMQSNNGIRFDGNGNAPIQSAKSTYTCPSNQGSPCPVSQNGVWGSAPQATKNFWKYPVPAIDFSAMTSNLATIKTNSQSGGIYLPPSNAQGYSLVFNIGGTVSVYKITSLLNNPTGYDVNGNPHNESVDYNKRTLQFTQAIPTNGAIYVEDNTWVEGIVKGRVMLAAAKLPYNAGSAPTIYIPNNITYAAKDGTNVLGLLAQKDVVITYRAPNTLEVDAALIAQNGSAQFFYYNNTIKTQITIYGAIMSYGQWTWSWVDGSGNIISGYTNTVDTYDGNLLYGPPPSFPVSASGYQQLSWSSN
jgi:hypothetical protein